MGTTLCTHAQVYISVHCHQRHRQAIKCCFLTVCYFCLEKVVIVENFVNIHIHKLDLATTFCCLMSSIFNRFCRSIKVAFCEIELCLFSIQHCIGKQIVEFRRKRKMRYTMRTCYLQCICFFLFFFSSFKIFTLFTTHIIRRQKSRKIHHKRCENVQNELIIVSRI